MKGRIKVVNSQGYGFITDIRKIDYFFHVTQFKGNWKSLLARYVSDVVTPIDVEFDVDITAEKAPRAINVSLIDNDKYKSKEDESINVIPTKL